jgi:hypothetical protein
MRLMHHFFSKTVILLLGISLVACQKDYVTINFNSEQETSGMKFALEDITQGVPSDWQGYEYVVLEFMITTPQRFHVGFNTDDGYNELRVMSYTPNGWNKLAIPLKFYNKPPAAKSDLAATFNQPRHTGWINLTGNRSELKGVDSIGIRMVAPIGNPVLKLRSVTLSKEDPGDQYLGDIPVVDEFGQYNLGNWEGKIYSLEQLQEEWDNEDNLPVDKKQYGYSDFGGYLEAKIDEGTGFFRTEKIDGKWWFVDPAGYLFLSHSVDCVNPGGGGGVYRLEQRENLYKELPPQEPQGENSRSREPSFGSWNLQRRYGDDAKEQAINNVFTRMDRWGLNTIANWSSSSVYNKERKAFTLQLRDIGIEGRLMGLADVYDPEFDNMIDRSINATVTPMRDNPWVLGYFTFNEPSFPGREQMLCDLILNGEDRPIKTELMQFLQESDTPEKRVEFVLNTFRIFIEKTDKVLEKYDPNHLSLGIRFGHEADTEILEICKDVFDVFSFNCYDLYPKWEMMDRFMNSTDKPMIIGEFHFGTVDRGMAQSLWQVDNQEERGVAYSYYVEKAYSHPGLIGTAYFLWCDQDLTGRGNDGENYNCGLVDVTDRPYNYLVKAVSESSKRLYGVHSGSLNAVERKAERARGLHQMPKGWDNR